MTALPRWPDGVTASFEVVTPEMAQGYLDRMHFNRNKSRIDIGVMTQNLEAGAWYAEVSPVFFDGGDPDLGEDRPWDGQHRFGAITRTGIPAVMLFVRGVSEEAARYADTGRRRTYADSVRMLGVTDYKRESVLYKFAALHRLYGIEGIRYPNKYPVGQDARDALIGTPGVTESVHLGSALYRAVQAKESLATWSVYVTGLGLDPDGFWGKVVTGDGPDGRGLVKGDPARTLREWYQQGRKRDRLAADPRVMFLYATGTAWNKHVREESYERVSPRWETRADGRTQFFPAERIPEFLPLPPGEYVRGQVPGLTRVAAAWREKAVTGADFSKVYPHRTREEYEQVQGERQNRA